MKKRDQKLKSKRLGRGHQSDQSQLKVQKVHDDQEEYEDIQEIVDDQIDAEIADQARVYSQQDMNQIKYSTYLQRSNRKYYMRRVTNNQPQNFIPVKGEKQFYKLLKNVENHQLDTRTIKKFYEFLLNNQGDQISEKEKQWYKIKGEANIRKTVRREKEVRLRKALKQIIEKIAKKCRRQKSNPPQVCLVEKARIFIIYTETQVINLLPEEQRNEIQELMSTMKMKFNPNCTKEIKKKSLENRDKNKPKLNHDIDQQPLGKNEEMKIQNEYIHHKFSPQTEEIAKTYTPLTRDIFRELINIQMIDHNNRLINVPDYKADAIENVDQNQEEMSKNNRETVTENPIESNIDQVYDPRISWVEFNPVTIQSPVSTIILPQMSPKSEDQVEECPKQIAENLRQIPKIDEQNHQQPVQNQESESIKFVKEIQNKSRNKFRIPAQSQEQRPDQNQKASSISQKVQSFQRKSSSSLQQSLDKIQKKEGNVGNGSRLITRFSAGSNTQNKRVNIMKQDPQKPLSIFEQNEKIPEQEIKIYDFCKQLYSLEKADNPNQLQKYTHITLDGQEKLKCLGSQKHDFIAPQSMFNLLQILKQFNEKHLKGEFKSNSKFDLSYFYDLNKESIFLQINSGNGVSCIHTAINSNCLSYGIDLDLDSILASLWLRNAIKSDLKMKEEHLMTTVDNAHFIHIDYEQLDHFSFGNFIPYPATHILYLNVEQNHEKFLELCQILENTSFRVLIWPLNSNETREIFKDSDHLKSQLIYSREFEYQTYFGGKIQLLHIYFRKPLENFLQNMPRKEAMQCHIKNEKADIYRHIESIKSQKEVLIPVLNPHKSGQSYWIRWITESQKSIQKSTSLHKELSQILQQSSDQSPNQLHKSPIKKSLNQQNHELQQVKAVAKELMGKLKNYKVNKYIYCGNIAIMFAAITDENRKIAMKVSQKGSYKELKVEEEIAKKIYEKIPNSSHLMKYIHSFTYDMKLHKKDIKKGIGKDRLVIIYQYYPLTLYDFKKQRFTQRLDVIKFVFTGIALGLQELHKNNFAHCDLKPTNILMDENMRPVLGDFGQVSQAIVKEFQLKGTASYMPIEYFTSGPVNASSYDYRKADIWSLGVILFQLIFKKYPFQMKIDPTSGAQKLTLTTLEVDQVFTKEYLPKMSPTLQATAKQFTKILDILKVMLDFNPQTRATINNILVHPFVKKSKLRFQENKGIQDPEFREKFNDYILNSAANNEKMI